MSPAQRITEADLPIVRQLLTTAAPTGVEMSCIGAAAREARILTGRDAETAVIVHAGHQGTWAGALVYFVLLEQLGQCFRRVGAASTKNEIEDALIGFGGVPRVDAAVVGKLRDRFAHDYSLQGRDARAARYALHDHDGQPLVTRTRRGYSVSLLELARVSEACLTEVRKLAELGQLESHHPGGLTRVQERFTMLFLEDIPA